MKRKRKKKKKKRKKRKKKKQSHKNWTKQERDLVIISSVIISVSQISRKTSSSDGNKIGYIKFSNSGFVYLQYKMNQLFPHYCLHFYGHRLYTITILIMTVHDDNMPNTVFC